MMMTKYSVWRVLWISAAFWLPELVIASSAEANPTGGLVAGGNATIHGEGSGNLLVEQHTVRAIINWQQFDIGQGETTLFRQPSADSVLLNRVSGGAGKASEILGSLRANGTIVLVNPDGILFGREATVDVGSLVATTADIRNEDFDNGSWVFRKAGNDKGIIENKGTIAVHDSGLATLVAPSVRNQGSIETQAGRITLAGASTMTLAVGGGLLEIAVDAATEKTLVDNQGMLKAGDGSILLNSATLEGVVSSLVRHRGRIETGNNGQVETSSAGGLQVDGLVKTGQWVIDPANITITASQPDSGINTAGAIWSSNTDEAVVSAASLVVALDNGSDITIRTTGTGAGQGDITLAEGTVLQKTTASNASLTLQAHRHVIFEKDSHIGSQGGKLDVQLLADSDGVNGGGISLNQTIIETAGGNILASGGVTPAVSSYASGSGSMLSGVELERTTLDAAGGTVTLRGKGNDSTAGSHRHGILIGNNSHIVTTSGDIVLDGVAGSGADDWKSGVVISGGSHVRTQDGRVEIRGQGAAVSGSENYGVWTGSSRIEATGNGQLFLQGTGGNGGVRNNNGVYLQGADGTDTVVEARDGTILIEGTGGTGSERGHIGVAVVGSTIRSRGQADISVTGQGGTCGNGYGFCHGVYVSGATMESLVGGAITASGRGGYGNNQINVGLQLLDASVVRSAGSGAITLEGSGMAGAAAAQGVALQGAGTLVEAEEGAVSISGTGGTSSTPHNHGVQITGLARVNARGHATLDIHGTGSGNNSNGVLVHSLNHDGRMVQVADGSMTITGQGGTTGTGRGIVLNGKPLHDNAATLATEGDGRIVLRGTGSSNVVGDNQFGVHITGGATIRAFRRGAVEVHGTSGGSGSSGIRMDGQNIANNGTGIYTDTGTVLLAGTGGSNGNNNLGVWLSGGGSLLSTSGTVTVQGEGNDTAPDLMVGQAGETAASTLGGATSNGNYYLVSDRMLLEQGARFDTAGIIGFAPRTAGTSIGVAGGTGTLSYNDSLFVPVQRAGTVAFGDSRSGTVVLGNGWENSPPLYSVRLEGATVLASAVTTATGNDLSLYSQGDITLQGAVTAGGNLQLAAGNDIRLLPAAMITSNTDDVALSFQAGGTIDAASALVAAGQHATVRLQADNLQVANTWYSNGLLAIAPLTPGMSVGVAGESGTLQLDETLLARFITPQLVIGDNTTGSIRVGSWDYSNAAYDVTLQGSSILLADTLATGNHHLAMLSGTGGLTADGVVQGSGIRLLLSEGNLDIRQDIEGTRLLAMAGWDGNNQADPSGVMDESLLAMGLDSSVRLTVHEDAGIRMGSSGAAITLASKGTFFNLAGSDAFQADNGWYHVYSNTPLDDVRGMTGGFRKRYGVSWGEDVSGYTGNAFFYAITPGLTLTPASQRYVYDGTGASFRQSGSADLYTVSGFIDGDTLESLNASGMDSVVLAADDVRTVGTRAIRVTDVGNFQAAGYALTMTETASALTVTPRVLHVRVADAQRVYGDDNPAFGVVYENFAASEDASVLGQVPTVRTAAGKRSAVGTYVLQAEDAIADNYTIEYHTGTLRVVPRSLTVQIENSMMDEGFDLPEFRGRVVGGLAEGDESLADLPASAFHTISNVAGRGQYRIGITLPDGYGNYSLSVMEGTLSVQASARAPETLSGGSARPETAWRIPVIMPVTPGYYSHLAASCVRTLPAGTDRTQSEACPGGSGLWSIQ